MKSKLKVLGVASVTVVVAVALLYTPLTNALQFGEGEDPDVKFVVRCKCRPWQRARLVWWFLNHSEPVEVNGTVVALFKDMLILNINEEQIRIHLPRVWTVDEELMPRRELFENGYLNIGESITVKALRADAIEKEGLCIYLLLGYEIIDECGVHAYAVLPFNIET